MRTLATEKFHDSVPPVRTSDAYGHIVFDRMVAAQAASRLVFRVTSNADRCASAFLVGGFSNTPQDLQGLVFLGGPFLVMNDSSPTDIDVGLSSGHNYYGIVLRVATALTSGGIAWVADGERWVLPGGE